jgi:hypothetical protein
LSQANCLISQGTNHRSNSKQNSIDSRDRSNSANQCRPFSLFERTVLQKKLGLSFPSRLLTTIDFADMLSKTAKSFPNRIQGMYSSISMLFAESERRYAAQHNSDGGVAP